MTFTNDELSKFIYQASLATYAGGGSYEQVVERPGFLEMVFRRDEWYYRDSYTGFYRSSGSEVVRFRIKLSGFLTTVVVWPKTKKDLASDTFNF
jgi:hypothetical protein